MKRAQRRRHSPTARRHGRAPAPGAPPRVRRICSAISHKSASLVVAGALVALAGCGSGDGGDAREAKKTYQADMGKQGAANFGEQALGLDPATSAAFGEQFGAIIRNEGTLGQAFLSFSGAINSLPDMLLGTFLPEETLGGMETWQKWAIILGTLLGAGGLLSGTDTGTVLGAIGLLGLLAGLLPSLFGSAVEEQQSDQPPTEQTAAAAPAFPAFPAVATPENPESVAALQSRMADPYPVLQVASGAFPPREPPGVNAKT